MKYIKTLNDGKMNKRANIWVAYSFDMCNITVKNAIGPGSNVKFNLK